MTCLGTTKTQGGGQRSKQRVIGRDYFEEVARLNDLLRSHESSARLSLDQISQLEGDLEKARSALAEAQDQGNTKIQVGGSTPTSRTWSQGSGGWRSTGLFPSHFPQSPA